MEFRELRGIRWHTADIDDMRRRAKAICRTYVVPKVVVEVVTKRGQGGSYEAGDDKILLDPDSGQNYMILAHELGHHVAWTRHGCYVQDHGPTWVKYYGQILDQLRMVPIEGFRAICRRHGVKMAR